MGKLHFKTYPSTAFPFDSCRCRLRMGVGKGRRQIKFFWATQLCSGRSNECNFILHRLGGGGYKTRNNAINILCVCFVLTWRRRRKCLGSVDTLSENPENWSKRADIHMNAVLLAKFMLFPPLSVLVSISISLSLTLSQSQCVARHLKRKFF